MPKELTIQVKPRIEIDRVIELLTDENADSETVALRDLLIISYGKKYRSFRQDIPQDHELLLSALQVYCAKAAQIVKITGFIDIIGDTNGHWTQNLKQSIAETRQLMIEDGIDPQFVRTDYQLLALLNTL